MTEDPQPTRRSRILAYLAVSLAAIAAGAVLAGLLLTSDGDKAPAAEAFGDSDAAKIERAFNSRDPAALMPVLAEPAGQDADTIARKAIPPGARLIIRPDSFRLLVEGLGTVEARVQGSQGGRFKILLQKLNGRWVVVSTSEPTDEPPK